MYIELETPHFLVGGRMIFENGPLTYAAAEVAFDPGIPVYAGVFLNHFGADFGVDPLRLGGLIGLSVIDLLQVDGAWDYLARRDGTIALSIRGHAAIAGGDLANLELQFWNDGYFSYSGRIGYSFPEDDPSFELYGQTDYWVEPQPGSDRARYQGHGELAVAFHTCGSPPRRCSSTTTTRRAAASATAGCTATAPGSRTSCRSCSRTATSRSTRSSRCARTRGSVSTARPPPRRRARRRRRPSPWRRTSGRW